MSVIVTTEVVCDGPDCHELAEGAIGPSVDRVTARKFAKEAGWIHESGRNGRGDLCPRCNGTATEEG